LQHLYPVVPVIGVLTDKKAFMPILDAAEVETIFDAPLEMFLKDENHMWEEHVLLCKKYVMHYFGYETDNRKFVIWGLTSSILIYAASVVYQRQPFFPGTKPDYVHYIRSRT
ncbi:nudix hydrolase 15, mitochondrial-like, partial [Phalaenopsis equestris]|uniref:nudix hydrolase 15, mitochondrial-like n=1 Tax=Phalaenopsis equestris TaxID=78828 RepID=UPI0009E49FEC